MFRGGKDGKVLFNDITKIWKTTCRIIGGHEVRLVSVFLR